MAMKEYVIPELPQDKEVHLFLCYHNSDENKVRNLVELLEREGLKCCYYDRDFTAGCSIFDSMQANIPKSVQMLVILSEEFNKCAYGLHELTLALHLQISEGYSIIPIMVEPCNVPACLKYIRYIDAKDIDVTDMPSLIIDAVVKNKIDADFKRTTGNQISVGLTKVKGCPNPLSLSRYKLEFDEKFRQKISDHNFQFTDGELKEIEELVSNSELVRYWHIFSHFVLTSSLLLFLLLLVYICIYLTFMVTIVGQSEASSTATLVVLHVCISVFILKLLVIYGISWHCDGSLSLNSKGSKLRILYQVWVKLVSALSRVNRDAREKGRIVMFGYVRGELILMRYDFRICQAYFIKRCEQQDSLLVYKKHEESLMEYTNRLFDDFVQSERCVNLIIPSATTRHTMSNGGKCLCLLVEEEVRKTK